MNPLDLVVIGPRGGKRVVGHMCGKCHAPNIHAWVDKRFPLGDAHTLAMATECCDRKCGTCGKSIEGFGYCKVCETAHFRDLLAERVAKARKVPWADAVETYRIGFSVATVGHDWDEVTFEALDELRDHCLHLGRPDPLIVHPLVSDGIKLDVQRIIESALEDHHEEAGDQLANGAREELQAALDAWAAKQRVETLYPDTKVVVVLPEGWDRSDDE